MLTAHLPVPSADRPTQGLVSRQIQVWRRDMISLRQSSGFSVPAVAFLLVSASAQDLHGRRAPHLTVQQSGTTNRLQAVSPVSSRVVWVSGVNGTYAVTT